MKHVIFAMHNFNSMHLGVMIERVNALIEEGETDILWVECCSYIGSCSVNLQRNKCICHLCKLYGTLGSKIIKNKNIKVLSVFDYLDETKKQELQNLKFDYNNASEIRSIKYKGSNIGLGVLSSYVTATRNFDPKIDDKTRVFFDELLRTAAKISELYLSIVNSERPDKIYVYNGRTIGTRSIVDLSINLNIDYTCEEVVPSYDTNNVNLVIFRNAMPHSISYNKNMIDKLWEENRYDKEREEVAHSFFRKRSSAEYTGDKIYISHQKKGLMPSNWDESKENIVIFNSSEDEFFAIGGEWDENKLFPTQLDGITTIIEHYCEDNSKHFYLKVHPNLMQIRYKYHTDLYKLDYPNLTVIPSDSSISTYEMMHQSCKVIVFGSSLGAEASYAHKPVIQLGNSLYNFANTTYIPMTQSQLWNLIDNNKLPHKYNDEILKYGYYIMSTNKGRRPKLDFSESEFSIGKFKKWKICNYLKLFGSSRLLLLFYVVYKQFFTLICYGRFTKWMPIDEN